MNAETDFSSSLGLQDAQDLSDPKYTVGLPSLNSSKTYIF
jgi:hypothetical protein